MDSFKNIKQIKNIKEFVDENEKNILNIYDFNMMKEEYLVELEIRNYSKNTIKTYSSVITIFIEFLENEKIITSKKEFLSVFRRFIQHLKRDDDVTQNYIYLVTVVLKRFLEFEDIHYLDSVSPPKRTKSLPKSLNEHEVNKLINSIKWNKKDSKFTKHSKMRDKLTLMILYSTGLRVSELVNIKINKIDFDERTILIRGKGDKDRLILFDINTKLQILEYLRKRPKNSEYLLINNKGSQISPRYVQMMIKKYADKAGINKKVTPHILRHSYATHLLKNGVDIRVIQQLLGHTSLSTTQIYTNVDMKTIQTLYDNAKRN